MKRFKIPNQTKNKNSDKHPFSFFFIELVIKIYDGNIDFLPDRTMECRIKGQILMDNFISSVELKRFF
jgi:hypothetical protein